MQWWRSAMWVCAVGACWNWAGAAGGLLSLAAARAQRQLATPPPSRAHPEQLAKRQPPWADVPEALRALYAQLAARDSLPAAFLPRSPLQRRTANTVRGFTHQGSAIDRRFKDEHRFRLSFNVTVPDGESLKAAELVLARDRVNVVRDDSSTEQKHKVLVYDIVKPGRKGQTKPVLRLVDAKWVKLTQDGSVNLDVTTAVERWLWRPEENHGLLVHVQSPEHLRQHRHVRLKRAAGERSGAWNRRRPALLAYTDDGRAPLEPVVSPPLRPARSKRAARRTHRRKDGRETCQRRPLFVDFTDVGWSDWIVAPNGYDAFYCHGDCAFPLTDHLNSTNHAIVQTLVNSVNPTAVPKACCVPTALSSISMLYLDEENKVVLKNYQDMAVMGCGCR